MRQRMRTGITVLALGTALAGHPGCARDQGLVGNEDRPPIIVMGGSIIMEMHPLPGESASRDWVDNGNGQNWKPNHQQGKASNKFIVSVLHPAGGECTGLQGTAVQLFHDGQGGPLHVINASQEPNIGPKGRLKENNSLALKTLTFTEGTFTHIRVAEKECQVNANSQVWIWPRS